MVKVRCGNKTKEGSETKTRNEKWNIREHYTKTREKMSKCQNIKRKHQHVAGRRETKREDKKK